MNSILDNSLDLKNTSREEIISELIEAVHIARSEGRKLNRYPFGFLRIPFETERNKDGMALHIWSDAYHEQETLHTHTFDLQSRVLFGEVANYVWSVSQTDCGAEYREIKIAHTLDQRILERPKDTPVHFSLISEDHFDHIHRSYYELPKDIVHSSAATEGAVTLIRRHNFDTALSGRLFVLENDERDIPIHKESDQVWDTVDKVLAKLRSNV